MRRIDERDEPEYGLIAAFKVVAVVLAIGILALVAGRSSDYNDPGPEASTKSQVIQPAPDRAAHVGANMQANGIEKGEQHVLAAAPATMARTEKRASEVALTKTSPAPVTQVQPVASF